VAEATDFGKLEDGSFFMVLEYVDGDSLRVALGKGRLELGRALHITRQIASGLSQAHAHGIVHRDLKPENVMLVPQDDTDFVKVLDFGIAKVPVSELAQNTAGDAMQVLTQLGVVYGTPEYMAPEQALGQPVDARADIYALGIMTYEMLTGSRPFNSESKVELLGMHVTAAVPRMSERAPDALVPPEVENIVRRMLEKEAGERFADAKELIETINRTIATLAAQGRVETKYAMPAISTPGSTGGLAGIAPVSAESLASAATAPAQILSSQITGLNTATPPDAAAKNRRALAILGGVVVCVLGLAAAMSTCHTTAISDADAGPTAVVSNSVSATPSGTALPELSYDDQLKTALGLLDKTNYGDGVKMLVALEEKDPKRVEVHLALENAYMRTDKRAEAMSEVAALARLDPARISDQRILLDVRNAALFSGSQDEAFSLLEKDMGSEGPTLLYDLAYRVDKFPQASERAKRLLAKPAVRAKATPTIAVTLDLQNALQRGGACAMKRYLDDAGQVGGQAALEILRPLQTTTGCGSNKKTDCYKCLRDGSLTRAITEIEHRFADGGQSPR
jgi:serine/threonine-protein kinase